MFEELERMKLEWTQLDNERLEQRMTQMLRRHRREIDILSDPTNQKNRDYSLRG